MSTVLDTRTDAAGDRVADGEDRVEQAPEDTGIQSFLVTFNIRRFDPEVDDERRRYYRLTPQGRRTLEAEAARHVRLVELARAKRVLPRPRTA